MTAERTGEIDAIVASIDRLAKGTQAISHEDIARISSAVDALKDANADDRLDDDVIIEEATPSRSG